MNGHDTGGTRQRILATARELFAAHGYRAASMRQIAEQLGISKPSLYHHFPGKAQILHSLIAEPIDELARVVASAGDDDGTRERILRGCIDVMVRHRQVMNLLLRDASVYSDDSLRPAERVLATVDRATELLAGPGADWRGRLRAAQAFAAATDPIGQFPDVDEAELREALYRGAVAVLDATD